MSNSGFKGFTLAEVLITLGVIGVVAAMTMPALIQNHRKHVVETRLAKFYSTINQAIKRAEVDHGEIKYWDTIQNGFEEDENGELDLTKPTVLPWFDKYLKPYISFLKIETSKHVEGRIIVYFTDGSAAMISGGTWLFLPEAKYVYKIETTNEEGTIIHKRRLYGGTKLFTFLFDADKGIVEPYGYNDTIQACKEDVPARSERACCAALIQRNGWKIPKDYPLKF